MKGRTDDGTREMKQIVKINSSRSHNIKQDGIMCIAMGSGKRTK